MAEPITIFMCGDVMTGRGIDQILPHPNPPRIYESYMKTALGYVMLAEDLNGPIPRSVNFPYIWGEALNELERIKPDVRIINLETAVTKSEAYEDKGINYRMHPDNIQCITAADIDYCSLANNHVLDWGYSGLLETLDTLKNAGLKYAGAGRNLQEAGSPSIMEVGEKGRVVVFSFGSETSGIPPSWGAAENRPGINMLRDFSIETVRSIKEKVASVRQKGDIVVASIHWGENWGYDVPKEDRTFARKLLDDAGVDIIHGHSSHHVKGIEMNNGRLILYGCGDFLNDYEGIPEIDIYRSDLGLMYFVTADPSTGKLISLHMTPTRIKNFKVNLALKKDALWLKNILNSEGLKFGTQFILRKENKLELQLTRELL